MSLKLSRDDNLMKDALLQTKLQPSPVTPDNILRDRLITRLEQGRHRPLTLISASAGYGKSSLASQWVTSCECRCGWVSLDENDSDLHLFLAYILATIQRIFPDVYLRTEILLEADPLPSSAKLASYLLNDLNQLPELFILVLDDYHRIEGKSVHDFVTALLSYPARTLNLVLLTRTHPPLPVAAMRGQGLVTEIKTSDLRFTTDEVGSFMDQMLNVKVDDDTVAVLEAKTEGWAVGLRLAGLYLQGGENLKKRGEELSGNSRYIAEYYFSEVLSQKHPEMLSYLLDTSILDRFCVDLCTSIHEGQAQERQAVSADQFIQWLKENNLFIIALDNEEYWFRYHHLFRDLLKDLLGRQATADRISSLNREAGEWFARNGLLEEAVKHLLAGGDDDSAVDLIRKNRYELMNTSQFARLSRLMAAFPQTIQEEDLHMLTTRALLGTDVGKNIDLYAFTQKATQLLAGLSPQSDQYPEVKGEVLVLQSLLDMLTGDADSGFSHVRAGLDYLPEDALMVKSLAVLALCICHQMTGNTREANRVVRRAVSNPFNPPNIQGRMQVCLSFALYLDASLPRVIATSEKCLALMKDCRVPHTRAYANYLIGLAHYMQNRLESAEHYLSKILDEKYSLNPAYIGDSGYMLVCIYLNQGRADKAEQVMDLLEKYCRENNHTRAGEFFQAFEAEFALRRGDLRQAQQICRYANFDAGLPRWFFYVPQFTPIKCLISTGTQANLKEAFTQLSQWDEEMKKINRINIRIDVLILLAVLHHIRKQDAAAMEFLETAMLMAEPGGWFRSFIDAGPPMATMLEKFLRNDPDHQFAGQILEMYYKETRNKANIGLKNKRKPGKFQHTPIDFLTSRETELLPFLAEGLSNKEIAGVLSISDGTVKTHLRNMFHKLDVTNRIEAVNKARRMGILNLG